MNCYSVEKNQNIEILNLYPLADLHLGSSECNFRAFRKLIKKIENDQNAAVLLLGDLFELDNMKLIDAQIEILVELLKPIAEKIIGIIDGNHELRYKQLTNECISERLAEELNVPFEYISEDGAYIFLTFGDSKEHFHRPLTYQIYATHGSGKAKGLGGKIEVLEKRCDNIPTADIVVTGHFHAPASFRKPILKIDEANKGILQKERLCVETNSWLNYGGYAERSGLPPASFTTPIITLNGQGKKNFTCTI